MRQRKSDEAIRQPNAESARQKRVRQLDLNLLKIFEVVFRERHLSRAAQSLALTPSAVSHALGRLREYLDDELFVRDGRSMQPTATCLRMAPNLLEQLAKLRQLLQQWGQFNPTETRQTFRLGMPDALEPLVLPALTRALSEQAPLAALASSPIDRKRMTSALSSGNLDLAIDIALPISEPLRHHPLLEDAFCIFVRRGHPLIRGMTMAKYLKANHVAVSTRAQGTVLEDVALLNLGLQRNISVRCQNYYSACRIVQHSDLLLTMPEKLAMQIDTSKSLVPIDPPFSLPAIHLHMYWHINSDQDVANQWFRKLITDTEARMGFQQ
ncbi:LysR family transcriptional regulator [Burkholderia aenigmatica]|uniref:LysR family transcriptional regulator n=1 Tax=Burkholderia aenigmatica TaxID=2015348 RepID=A0ABY6XX92_9BURK|nr:LysR family transcriptional regulator [Burkholderia aenigmatica]VWC73736.1 LysR family transcriptional regulator [Burkholderia aenigmatica]